MRRPERLTRRRIIIALITATVVVGSVIGAGALAGSLSGDAPKPVAVVAGATSAAPQVIAEGARSDATQVPASVIAALGGRGAVESIPYAGFIRRVDAGRVQTAVIDPNGRWVAGVVPDGSVVTAALDPRDRSGTATGPGAVQLGNYLRTHDVVVLAPGVGQTQPVASEQRSSSRNFASYLIWIIGLSVLAMCLVVFFRRRSAGGGGGLRGHGKVRKEALATPPDIRFADVAGCDEAVEELSEMVTFIKDAARFARVGARMPRGCILWGPPGTGKTLLAKAVAGEAGVPFYAVAGSEFVDTFVGVGASRVRDLFAKARAHEEGAVIFFDEIDAVGRQRGAGMGGGADSEREATLNQLLTEMDGFTTRSKVMVIAATNRLDLLDKALTRPGRFDRNVQVGLPTEVGRREILALHAKGKPFEDAERDLAGLARTSGGASGADLANILNEAAIMAARGGRSAISGADLAEGQLRAMMGPAKRNQLLGPGEREVIAWHEAGHALAAEICPTHSKAQRVTILARGQAAGLAMYPQEDRALYSPQQLHEVMVVALAGRAAEQLRFGRITSGAANDLEKVNGIARQAVEVLGFSPKVGQIIARSGITEHGLSESTRRAIDEEIGRMVDEAYQDALDLLTEHDDELEALALALLEREQLEREEIAGVLAEPRRAPASRGSLPTDRQLPPPEPLPVPVDDPVEEPAVRERRRTWRPQVPNPQVALSGATLAAQTLARMARKRIAGRRVPPSAARRPAREI